MKVKYLVDEEHHIEIELVGEEYSIPAVIKDILAKNKDVEFVTYVVGHPSRDNPKLVLKTRKKNAKQLLKDALAEAIKVFEDMKKEFGK